MLTSMEDHGLVLFFLCTVSERSLFAGFWKRVRSRRRQDYVAVIMPRLVHEK